MNSKRKAPDVALILDTLQVGGAEKVFVSLANQFVRFGLFVNIVVVRRSGPLIDDLDSNIRVTYLKGGREVWSRFPSLCRYIRSHRPKSVLSAFVQINAMVVLACKLVRSRSTVVITEHTTFSISHGVKNRVSRRQRLYPALARFVYPYADELVAVSTGVADDLAQVAGLPRSNIAVIYNPVEQFAASRDLVTDGAGEYKNRVARIVCCGRLEPAKDFSTLIRAVYELGKERSVRVDLLGNGSQKEALQALARELGVRELITFHGHVSDPFEFYKRADVFVLSSAWEGFGNVLVEAMACGLPVVSTDCPSGPAEILDNGAYGPLVSPDNPGALAKAIASVLDRPTDPDSLVCRAKEFLPAKAADKYRRLLGV